MKHELKGSVEALRIEIWTQPPPSSPAPTDVTEITDRDGQVLCSQ